MLCAGIADRFGQRLPVNIIQIAGNGDDDTGLPKIGNTDCLAEEILQHQFSNIEIGNKAVPDRINRHQPFRGAAKEKSGFIADSLNGMAVLPVKHNQGRFRNDNTASAHIEADVFGAEVNSDIRSQKRHIRINPLRFHSDQVSRQVRRRIRF